METPNSRTASWRWLSVFKTEARMQYHAVEKIPAGVLLIAGPSGAGKSTFIDHLKADQLPDEIQQWLPEGAKDWPSFEANDLLKRGNLAGLLDAASGGVRGVICHYDTFFALRYGLTSPSNDPIWPVFREARSLSVVSIEPTYERLRAQFLARFDKQMASKGVVRRVWHRFGNLPIKRFKYHVLGQGVPDTAWIYRSQKQVRDWYARWDASLQALAGDLPFMRILSLEPVEDHLGRNTFSIKAHDGHEPSAVGDD